MLNYQNILVIIDPNQHQQAALNRALELAQHQQQTKLTLLMAIYDFSYEMTAMLSSDDREAMRSAMVNERSQWLADLAEPHQNKGAEIELKVVWHSRPFESVLQQVLTNNHDLVIKSTHIHPKLRAILFTPTDWHLLRKCPAPLLLVKQHDWPKQGNILVAVNSNGGDEAHNNLNNKLITQGQALAALLDAKLHIANAYPSAPINLALELPEFDVTDYSSAMAEHHHKSLSALADKFNIPNENSHLIEGQPEDVIAELANELDAELVLLGTIGRTGFSAAIIGNTAEHIIDQLNCDLLAIKPDGYISPFQASS